MRIAEAKKHYQNRWVLAEVLKENQANEPVEVRPIMTSTDRNKLYERIAKLPKGKTFTTFSTREPSGSFL